MLRINRRDAMVGHQSHLQNRQQIHAENSPRPNLEHNSQKASQAMWIVMVVLLISIVVVPWVGRVPGELPPTRMVPKFGAHPLPPDSILTSR